MKRIRNHEVQSIVRAVAGAASAGARDAERRLERSNVVTRAFYAAWLTIVFLVVTFSVGCSSNSSSTSTASSTPQAEAVTIAATSGTTQSAPSGKPFAAPFTATVTTNGIVTNGESVTFTAPASGASGTFANGMTTEVDVTNASGVATSSTFTANTTAGSFTVSAMVSGASAPVTYSLTTIGVTPYVYSMSGQELNSGSYYAVAGSILVDSTGNVQGGEQDYNDGGSVSYSPQPSGDVISGGTLTVDSTTGQGTLSLITNNLAEGVPNSDGVTSTETFGVQFVNANHALIMQFDGTATSSGSLDLQTQVTAPSGNFAFTLSGLDAFGAPVDFGGVVTIGGTAITGTYDVNEEFNGVKKNKAWGGTVDPPDVYGRGTVTGLVNPGVGQPTLRYYMVGPEVFRIIDVSVSGTELGSAFGQGTGIFSAASLGSSVFTVAGNYLNQYGAVGQFGTDATASTFTGVGDEVELTNYILTYPQATPISGTYSLASNGYGNLAIPLNVNTNQGLGDISALGFYMTDPTLNLSDPNNKTAGSAVGGGLIADLDSGSLNGYPLSGGVGVIVPQTDAATAAADFTGNYAAGWQNLDSNCGCEFDMIAQGTMTQGGSLDLTGLVSDPYYGVSQTDQFSSGDTFIGIPSPDANNPGRYELTTGPDQLRTFIDGATGPKFDMIIYQANGGQLFWLNWDNNDYDDGNGAGLFYLSVGPIEQQGSLAGLPAAQGPVVIPRTKTRFKRR